MLRLQHLALWQVHPSGRLLDGGGHKVLLERGEGDRAARFNGQNLGDLGAAALHDLGRLEEQLCSLGWSRLRPGGKCLGGRVNRQLRFRSATRGDACIEAAIVRPIDVEQLVIFSRAPFAAREVPIFFDAVHFGYATHIGHHFFSSKRLLGLAMYRHRGPRSEVLRD